MKTKPSGRGSSNQTRRRPTSSKKAALNQASSTQFQLARSIFTDAAPHVATHWLGDPEYRAPGPNAEPRRLRLRGRGPSLSKLIRRVWPQGDVKQMADFLVTSGAVRRVGQYFELQSRFVPFRADAATALSHTIKTIQRYLETVSHNMACAESHDTWIERSATNHNIPAHAAPLARRYVRRKVESLISAVDAYWRRLEAKASSGPKVAFSLNGFASRG